MGVEERRVGHAADGAAPEDAVGDAGRRKGARRVVAHAVVLSGQPCGVPGLLEVAGAIARKTVVLSAVAFESVHPFWIAFLMVFSVVAVFLLCWCATLSPLPPRLAPDPLSRNARVLATGGAPGSRA